MAVGGKTMQLKMFHADTHIMSLLVRFTFQIINSQNYTLFVTAVEAMKGNLL